MNKTAIITGASRGIGWAAAKTLADEGHRVIGIARTEARLEQLRQGHPENIEYICADLTNNGDLQTVYNSLQETDTVVDILINNAGALINKSFADLSSEDWQHMINANLMTAVNLTKKVLPLMPKKSHIVNVSSMGGFQGSSKFPGLTAYSVAKGALSILTECLAAELSEQAISVNALCLGSVQTEMFDRAFPGFDAATSAENMGTYIADFALNGSAFYNGKLLPVALSNPS